MIMAQKIMIQAHSISYAHAMSYAHTMSYAQDILWASVMKAIPKFDESESGLIVLKSCNEPILKHIS